MFKHYLQFISNIIDTVKTGKGDITFWDYLGVLGNTFLLVLIIVLIIALAAGCFAGPKYTWGKLVGTVEKTLSDTLLEGKFEKIHALEATLKKRKILFFILLFGAYMPFVVPTFLYVLYLVFHI